MHCHHITSPLPSLLRVKSRLIKDARFKAVADERRRRELFEAFVRGVEEDEEEWEREEWKEDDGEGTRRGGSADETAALKAGKRVDMVRIESLRKEQVRGGEQR